MSDNETWRLRISFDEPDALESLQRRIEQHAGLDEDAFSEHDDTVFAYAATRDELEAIRAKVDTLMCDKPRSTGIIRVCRWDEDVAQWRQVDPPLEGEARELDEALAQAAGRVEARTLTCAVGRLEDEIFKSLLREYAQSRGISCTLAITHRGLFGARLAATVTGAAARLDDFEEFMRDQARRTRHVDAGSIPISP